MNNQSSIKKLLQHKNISELEVRKFFWLTLAPTHLTAVRKIAINLQRYLPQIRTYLPECVADQCSWDAWNNVCEYLGYGDLDELDEMTRLLLNKKPGKHQGTIIPPTWGMLGNHALYSAAWFDCEEGVNESLYEKLNSIIFACQFHFLLLADETWTQIEYESKQNTKDFFGPLNSVVEKIGKILRECSYCDKGYLLEQLFEDDFKSIDDFYEHVKALCDDDPENMDFNSIRIFLERIWYQEASNKGGGGGGRGGHVDIEKLRYGFVDLKNGIRVRVPDIYESHGVKSTRVITRPVTEDVDEWLEAGLPLEELFDEEIVVIDEYEEHEPPSSRVIRTMCQKNYLSTQNNNLPYASGDLTGKNVHHIYNRCITKIQESLELINNNEMEITHEMMVKLEVPIIVLVTLLTGSDYVDVKNLSKLSSSNAQYSKLAYLEDRGLWRIKMDFPKKKIKISLLQKSISEEMTDLLELPDYFGIGQYLDKLKAYYLKYDEQKKYQRKTGKNKYFRIQEKKSKKLIREFLIKIFPDEDISIAKVKGYLFKRITVNTGGDTVVAMLITRRKHYTGQTQLYYSMPTLAYLQEVYSDAVSSIATINDIKNNNRLISQHIYAGNRVLPSTESINQLLMCVKAKLYAHRGSNSLSNFIVFHNEYTLYTLLMLLYATGYRAVIEPWIEPDEIDRHGFVVISDKGRKDHYSERLVWVPKVLRDQLESYHLHCCLVKMELASLTELDITHINEITEKMFFLDKISMEPISIRPRTWSAYVEDRFPVAMNVGRHYLRTRLMMDRCPPDIINTFMGHHVNGTEPWGTKSTLSPLGYKKEIEVYIEEVMDTLGFEKISGWMRK